MDENNFQYNYNPSMNDNMSFNQPQGFEQPVVEQPINNGFQPQPQQPKKKKSGIKILIIVLVLLLVIGGGAAAYYFMVVKSPRTAINSFFDSIDSKLGEAVDLVEGNSELDSFKFSVNVEPSDNTNITSTQYVDILNNSDLQIALGIDKVNKKASINLSINYNNDTVSLCVFFDSQTKGVYVYSKEILGKTIKVAEATDETIESFINSLSDTTDTKNFVKAAQMVLKAFKNNIKDNMITSKDATYTANGKEVKATKNTIHLDEDSVKTLGYNVCKELSNNSEFMNLFKGNMQTILKSSLNSVIERYETKSEDTTSSSYSSYVTTPLTDLDFSIYTTGFIPKATRYEFYQRYEVRYSEEYLERISKSSYNNYKSPTDDGIQEISSTVAVNIIDDNNYEIVISGGGVTQAININMNTDKNDKNKGEVSISTDYASFGKISVNIAYQRELNREVPAPQTTGAITLNQLTSADYQKLLTDLSAHEVTKPLASSAYYLIMYLYYAQQQSTTTSTNPLASLYGTTDITNTTSTTPDTTSTVPAGKQKIGDEDNGYLVVADTWTDAYGATSRLQYANYPNGATGSVSAVLTMDNESTLEHSAEEWATTIYNSEKNDSKTKTVNASTTKVGNYNAYKVEKERNDGYKQIGWFFETEDGKTHCIIIGGTNLTEDTLSIVDTYTVE